MNRFKSLLKLFCPPIIWIILTKIFKRKNKIVCYTCITGGYDFLIPVFKKDDKVDYICFTDNINIDSRGWEIRKIPDDLNKLSPKLQNRMIKLKPHLFLNKYKYSLYIDGNIIINCKVSSFVKRYNFFKKSFYVNKHPYRDCLYEESKRVIEFNIAPRDAVVKQMDRYKNEGFPKNFGLTENNILLRKHNSKKCIRLMNMWANEIMTETYRDQLSLMYCVWKQRFNLGLLRICPRLGDFNQPFLLRLFHNTNNKLAIYNSTDEKNITYVREIKI